VINVEAPVRPSEDSEKVKRAILNLFPDLQFEDPEGRISGTTESWGKFADILRRHRIRDAARGVMMRGMRGETVTSFCINKQAAFMGKVSFSESESPLGDIRITFEDPQLQNHIDSIAPDTRPPAAIRAARKREAAAEGAGKHGGRSPVRWDWRKEFKELEEE
jgi:uncharacterized protein